MTATLEHRTARRAKRAQFEELVSITSNAETAGDVGLGRVGVIHCIDYNSRWEMSNGGLSSSVINAEGDLEGAL